MSKLRVAAHALVAIAVTAIVGGCGSTELPTAAADAASVAEVSVPSAVTQVAPAPTPGPAPTAAPTATPTPTQALTPSPAPAATPTLAPTPKLAALPKLSKQIPGATKVRYFPIVGESPGELVRQTVAKSAGPCNHDDTLACVSLGGSIGWTNTTNGYSGACTVTSVTVSRRPTVYLPRWVGPHRVQPALITWWKEVLGHFAWHEGRHIKIQQSYDRQLRQALIGHKCSAARSIIKRWSRSLEATQHRFDVSDYSWQPEWSVPYTGPQG